MLTKDQIEDILKLSDAQSDIIVDRYVEKIVAVLDMLKVVDFADYSFVLTDHKTGKKTEIIKQNQHYSYSYDENVDHIKQKNRDSVSFSEEMDLSDDQISVLKSEKCDLMDEVSDQQSGKTVVDAVDDSDSNSGNCVDGKTNVDTNNTNSDEKTDTKLLDLHKNLYQNCKTLMQQTAGYYKTQINYLGLKSEVCSCNRLLQKYNPINSVQTCKSTPECNRIVGQLTDARLKFQTCWNLVSFRSVLDKLRILLTMQVFNT